MSILKIKSGGVEKLMVPRTDIFKKVKIRFVIDELGRLAPFEGSQEVMLESEIVEVTGVGCIKLMHPLGQTRGILRRHSPIVCHFRDGSCKFYVGDFYGTI